ncbi:hypothetical protein Y032_0791g2370 [Ancylostoma ceylanicum]|uniref:Uncharacterized protein n=1 Tax=Ancylostoma ceylanicum TaxID=53326 RepID=A0A016WEK4_9BILA|nr:hypothetical protein Y032_0791g2370 [Ancylostoma ceylanicum]
MCWKLFRGRSTPITESVFRMKSSKMPLTNQPPTTRTSHPPPGEKDKKATTALSTRLSDSIRTRTIVTLYTPRSIAGA